jgi:hypothetical protein
MAREFTNDKIVSEMTRDGLQEHNLTTGDINRVSKRFEEYSYSATGSTGEVFRKNRNADFQKGHSFQQKYYHRNFQKSLTREKEYAQREERYAEKIGKKESHMHRKHHLHIQQVQKYDYKAYGKLGRPKNYQGEEHYKYVKRLQNTPKLYRTRDLAVTRGFRGAGKVFFRRAEAMYFQDDEDNTAQKIFHDSYRMAKHGKRYVYGKLSHPVNKMRNTSYKNVNEKYVKTSSRETRQERKTGKYRFKLQMESAWQKELRLDKELQRASAARKWKKKLQFKHMYKKRYEQTFVQKIKNNFIRIVKKTKEIILKKIKSLLLICMILLIFGVLFYSATSIASILSTMGVNGVSQLAAGLYVTGFDEITSCDNYFSKTLNDFQNEILEIEESNQGYDEYQYWVNGIQVRDAEEMIKHVRYDQIELASYLSTMIPEYTLETAVSLMDSLFEKMFVIEQEEVIERRKRPATNADGTPVLNADGSTMLEEYDCHIWKTMLTTLTITEIMQDQLTENEYSQYDTFCRSEGNLKIYGSPFAMDNWHDYISSYFGYRNHPIEGKRKLHKGIDIAVPTGTKIFSVMEGTVKIAGYSESAGNWVVIEDKDGYVSKYMHCNSLLVAAGAQVKKGQLIATVGSTGHSTGAHLHLQIEDSSGTPVNPLYICSDTGKEKNE